MSLTTPVNDKRTVDIEFFRWIIAGVEFGDMVMPGRQVVSISIWLCGEKLVGGRVVQLKITQLAVAV